MANNSREHMPSRVEQSLETSPPFLIAIAQISTDPGAIEENTSKIISSIRKAKEQGASLIVFPELVLSGYLALDLFSRPAFLRTVREALEQIRQESVGITAIIGFPHYIPEQKGPNGSPLVYNAAAVLQDGLLIGVQHKTLLPEYDIFYEKRYFTPAVKKILIEVKGKKFGIQICEDLWKEGYEVDPTQELIQQGAECIVNLSASPFHLGKLQKRIQLIESVACEHTVPIIYTNLVGSFDGHEGEVVFDGRSLVVNAQGEVCLLASAFTEELLFIDLHTLSPAPVLFPSLEEELHGALVLGIKDFFRRVGKKAGFSKAIVGLSGGIDSAVVAALAVEALGKEQVVGISLPSRYNSEETKSDARLVAEQLGITFKESPIQRTVEEEIFLLQQDPEYTSWGEDVTEENIQARVRAMRLMAYANKLRAVVLNTGNRTELGLNNCTLYGDMIGAVSILGDVDKDRVYALAHYLNRRGTKEIIPQSIIDRVPSAELKPNQSDAQVMGGDPSTLSPLLRCIIEEDLSLSETIERFSSQFSKELICSIFRKLDASEGKRRQAPPTIRVTQHTFGDGRRIPMNHGFQG